VGQTLLSAPFDLILAFSFRICFRRAKLAGT